ncbi:MAG: phosphatase PAP2 family protein [Halobacteriales archaeon]
MSRGLGAIEAVRSLLPEGGVEALAALTALGDFVVVFLVLVAVYVFYDREGGAVALVVFAGGALLITGLKAGLAMPRPPESLQAVPEDGYGFPSGHAFSATVGFGLLALVIRRGRRSVRFGLAALGIALVSLSRVAIGVHYAVDVLAGAALGVAYLWVAWAGRDRLSTAVNRVRRRVRSESSLGRQS